MGRLTQWTTWGLCGLLAAVLIGCGGSGFDVAKVRGKVTCEGKPVPGGTIRFSPKGEAGAEVGKTAVGTINQNGEYVLSAYGENDGAVVGTNTVEFVFEDPGDIGEELEELEADEKDGELDPEDKERLAELRATFEIAKALAKIPCREPKTSEVQVKAGEENVIDIELVTEVD